jgi:hypothetical protein
MRVRKGTVERDDTADDDEWTLRAACVKARLLVAERESQLSAEKPGAERDWEALRARARATEEREWEMLRARVRATEEREWEELRLRAHATEARTRQELPAREALTGACIVDRDSRPRAELGRVVFWP